MPNETPEEKEIRIAQKAEARALAERVRQSQQLVSALSGGNFGGFLQGGAEKGIAETIAGFAKLHPAITATAVTVGALGYAAKMAAGTLLEIGQARLATGGSAGQIGTLGGIFSAVGLGSGQVGGVARSLREQVAGGGLGSMAGGQLGIPIRPVGVGAPPNEARFLLQAIERLRMMSESQARLTAERLPALQPFLSTRLLSDEQMQRFQQLGQQMEEIATPESVAQAQVFNAELALMVKQFQMLAATIGSKILPVVNAILGGANKGLGGMDAGQLGLGAVLGPLGAHLGRGRGGGAQRAQEENTRAMEKNTQAVEMLGSGLHGAGRRGQAAIPAGLAGDALDRALRTDSVRLGAY